MPFSPLSDIERFTLAEIRANFSTIAQQIFEQTYLKPFNNQKKDNLYDKKLERVTHGAQHASRVALYIPILIKLCQEAGVFEASQMSDDDITLLQLAALFHDAARQNDGKDYWEKESALQFKTFLEKRNFSQNTIERFMQTITHDNDYFLNKLLQTADGLDIMRVRKQFKLELLSLYPIFSKNPALKDKFIHCVLEIRKLIDKQYDMKFPCEIRENNIVHHPAYRENKTDLTLKTNYEQAELCYEQVLQDINDLDFPLLNHYLNVSLEPTLTTIGETIQEGIIEKDFQKLFQNCLIAEESSLVHFVFSNEISCTNCLEWIRNQLKIQFPEMDKLVIKPNRDENYPFEFSIEKIHYDYLSKLLNEYYERIDNDLLDDAFYFKVVRTGKNEDQFRNFVKSITKPISHEKRDVGRIDFRVRSKKQFTVDGEYVGSRFERYSQYNSEEKKTFSEIQSTSFYSKYGEPSLFKAKGADNKNKTGPIFIKNHCAFLYLTCPPSFELLKQISFKPKSAYVLFNNSLYYLNQLENQFIKLDITEEELLQLTQELNLAFEYNSNLSTEQLRIIRHITHHEHLDNVLLSRRSFIYQKKPSALRPYDFDSREEAIRYYQDLANKMLFTEERQLKRAIEDPLNLNKINESMIRLRSCAYLFVGDDTLEARLIAQERVRILQKRLSNKVKEDSKEGAEINTIPICFYMPESPLHKKRYGLLEQIADKKAALAIYQDESKRLAYYNKSQYEFLLALDKTDDLLNEKVQDNLLIFKMLQEGYGHWVESLLEKASPESIDILIANLSSIKLSQLKESINNALKYGNQSLAIVLIKAKLPVINKTKNELFIKAVDGGNKTCVEMLLQQGANPLACNEVGHSAYLIALRRKNYAIANLIAEQIGGEESEVCTTTKRSLDLIQAIEKGDRDKAILLLEEGADPNIKDQFGRSAFLFAINHQSIRLLELFIEKGVDLDVVDEQGQHVLDLIDQKGYYHLLSAFHGKLNFKDGISFFHFLNKAINAGNLAALEAVISADQSNFIRKSPRKLNLLLRQAVESHHFDVVLKLIELGANPDLFKENIPVISEIILSCNQALIDSIDDYLAPYYLQNIESYISEKMQKAIDSSDFLTGKKIINAIFNQRKLFNQKPNYFLINIISMSVVAGYFKSISEIKRFVKENELDLTVFMKELLKQIQCYGKNQLDFLWQAEDVTAEILNNKNTNSVLFHQQIQVAISLGIIEEVLSAIHLAWDDLKEKDSFLYSLFASSLLHTKNHKLQKIIFHFIHEKDNKFFLNINLNYFEFETKQTKINLYQWLFTKGIWDPNGFNQYKSHFITHFAVDNLELCQFLIEDLHVNFDLIEEDGTSPLFNAIKYKNFDVADYLLSRYLKTNQSSIAINQQSLDTGDTILHLACKNESQYELVEKIISLGARCNITNKDKKIALHSAVLSENPRLITLILLKDKSAINAQDKYGSTPLHIAVQTKCDNPVFETLLENGADLLIQNNAGQSPLSLAIRYNKATIALMMIKQIDLSRLTNVEKIHLLNLAENKGMTSFCNFLLHSFKKADWSAISPKEESLLSSYLKDFQLKWDTSHKDPLIAIFTLLKDYQKSHEAYFLSNAWEAPLKNLLTDLYNNSFEVPSLSKTYRQLQNHLNYILPTLGKNQKLKALIEFLIMKVEDEIDTKIAKNKLSHDELALFLPELNKKAGEKSIEKTRSHQEDEVVSLSF